MVKPSFQGMHKGVRIESYYVTGGWSQVVDHLEKSLTHFSRTDRHVAGVYIGIASGYNQLDGLKGRIDMPKQHMGINRMVCVYESTSRSFVENIEAELIKRFKEVRQDPRSFNTGPGKEGRKPQPDKKNYLYLAFRYDQPDIEF